MAESIPLFDKGDSLTGKASAAVTGARFLRISGAPDATDGNFTVAHAAAGGPVIGISAHDAALGETVGIHHATAIVTEVEAGAALTAGTLVQSSATGTAVVYAAGVGVHVAGIALNDAASGAKVLVSRVINGGG